MLSGASPESSIAVLPFQNLSGDPAQSYFSDGLASEIRTQLSRNPLMQIVGQASSNSVRDYRDDAKRIAKELGVAFLLDGNVQRSGDRVKIAVDLTDGRTGLSKWVQIFERPIVDIFAVQSEIGIAIASALSGAITGNAGREQTSKTGGTKSVAAFDAFLRGKDLFDLHIDENSERQALAKFEEAIARDGKYAAARAARARSLAVIANQYVEGQERIRLYDAAIAEAQRATALAPEFADGYNALGYSLFYGRLDVAGAREPYSKAYALGKNDVDVLSRYAIYSARTGHFDEAEAAIMKASVLDPLNPSMFKSAGLIKYATGEYDEAIALAKRALQLNPRRSTLHGDIGNALLMKGQIEQAVTEFELESSKLSRLPGQAVIAHRAGNRPGADQALSELQAEFGNNALYQQAQIYAQWNDVDAAFSTLYKARTAFDSGLVYLLNDPFLEPLRDDARFKTLLSGLKFT